MFPRPLVFPHPLLAWGWPAVICGNGGHGVDCWLLCGCEVNEVGEVDGRKENGSLLAVEIG